MAYRVAGRPHLETTRPQGDASELFQGKIDVQDLRPGVLSGLERVGRQLGQRISIFSGYRTSAYSEHVGGFAGDPHSRHIAVDANIGSVPIGNYPRARRLLEDAGFISGAQPNFYRGRSDPAHAQLRDERGGSTEGPGGTITLSELWVQAGGRPNLANIMAAIAIAESGGRVNAVGGPNSDGSYDYGLWQINSIHNYNRTRLLNDPSYNAHAAVDIQRTQGLDAWTVYRTGAYREHLGQQGPQVPNEPPRTRPGGGSTDSGAAERQAANVAWYDYINPLGPYGPLDTLGDLYHAGGKAVHGIDGFFHWIAWIFHPRNILRIVEFLTGAGLFALGIAASMKVFEGGPGGHSASKAGSAAGALWAATPPGRATRVARAARGGRKAARHEAQRHRESEARKAGRRKEQTKLTNKKAKREARRTPASEIPF